MARATCDTIGTKIRKFNDYIRGELKRRKISQDALADYLGVSRSTLTYRLNGRIEWSLRDTLKVMEFLDFNLNEI